MWVALEEVVKVTDVPLAVDRGELYFLRFEAKQEFHHLPERKGLLLSNAFKNHKVNFRLFIVGLDQLTRLIVLVHNFKV